ncbi:MAG: SRPBCC family protein [Ilumatobacteraceae bacterium]
MRTATFHETAVIDRPVAHVWALIADYDVDPLWRNGVSAMNPEPPGLVRVGTTTLEILRFAGRTYRIPGEVTDLRPGRSFAWHASKAHGTRHVDPIDDSSCVVTLTMHVQLAGAERVFGRLLARMMRRNLAGDLGRLVQLACDDSTRPLPSFS